MTDINKLGLVYSEEHKKIEDEAIEKYEKGSKSYRKDKKWRPFPKQITCAKCGTVFGTMVQVDGFWFCTECIKQRMRELKVQEKESRTK